VKTPVIAVTGNEGDEVKQACLNSGMNGMLIKPIERHTFYAEARRVVNNEFDRLV
jgi:CheY-like chemotaxis protein